MSPESARRVLLVKLSSLGDVIHTFPALSEALQHRPGLQVDWLVEKAFAELASWHPAVREVIPVSLRGLRKAPFEQRHRRALKDLRQRLKASVYDLQIDAQGLVKSALLTLLNPAPVAGYAASVAREPLASLAYDYLYDVAVDQHAVTRSRQLFAATLGYALPSPLPPPHYGLQLAPRPLLQEPYVFLLHGTTWDSKHFPESRWTKLVEQLLGRGLRPVVTWGNEDEHARAARLAAQGAHLFDRATFQELAAALKGARGVIAVDTGLGHLATALDVPVAGLYGPTDAARSGFFGPRQQSLSVNYHCAPCRQRVCRYHALQATPPCWDTLSDEHILQQVQSW